MIIDFNRKLYPLKAIYSSLEDYRHLCRFSVRKNKKYARVIFRNINEGIKDRLRDEFCNYVMSNIVI